MSRSTAGNAVIVKASPNLGQSHPEEHLTPREEATKILRELGFSEAECSIYFRVLEKEKGIGVDELLERSNVSASMTETAIGSLVDRGLVTTVSNKLMAVEPRQFVQRVQELKRAEVSRSLEETGSRTSRLLSLLEPQFWESRLGVRPEDLLEPLLTLEDMEVRTVRVIGNSKSQVLISAETFGWFVKVQEEAYRAIERGVRFRVLMSGKSRETLERVSEIKTLGMEVRKPREDWYPVRGTLSDDSELVFLIWVAREKDVGRAKFFRPHYSRNPGMIRVFSDAFEKRWADAKQF